MCIRDSLDDDDGVVVAEGEPTADQLAPYLRDEFADGRSAVGWALDEGREDLGFVGQLEKIARHDCNLS